MKELEKQLKALANARRIKILKYLERANRASVGNIAKEIKLSFKSTSRHLAVLRAAEMVSADQQGLTVIYSLENPKPPVVKLILDLC